MIADDSTPEPGAWWVYIDPAEVEEWITTHGEARAGRLFRQALRIRPDLAAEDPDFLAKAVPESLFRPRPSSS